MATVKLGELCRLLCDHADVRVVVTAAAKNFVTDEELPAPARPILVVRGRRGQRVGQCCSPAVAWCGVP